MILKDFLIITALLAALLTSAATAQDESSGQEAGDDEAITILDQVVPVANEGPPEPEPADEVTNDQEALLEQFERFKELKDAGVLDQAENVAKRVVELSIRVSGPTSNDTARALNNLAVVQHGLGNYEAAQQNFESAIDILKENEDQLSALLINPLQGLGAAQLAGGRPDLAYVSYSQAVHVSHVNDGPHNINQVDILEGLAETNLRLGAPEDARNIQDQIYSLNLRHYAENVMEMIPPLMRLARWQRRTGYIIDERATYRRVIRILEQANGKDDLSLIDPLLHLGRSYFYIDTSDAGSYQSASIASGEMYFKRAVRISEENPESSWELLAQTKLALGDYYSFRSDQGRARKVYADVWDLLSVDETRFDTRRDELERAIALNEDPIPQYIGGATRSDRPQEDGLREGRIIVSYDVTARGRVANLKIVEATPAEFQSIRRVVVRELRTRIFRPRFEDARPVATPNQSFSHSFFYRQEALDNLRLEAEAEDS